MVYNKILEKLYKKFLLARLRRDKFSIELFKKYQKEIFI